MDLLGVQAFLAIVQTGSLNKASELLHLSQGAVSYRLKALEQGMGRRLVERGKGIHKVRLTPMGENFLTLAERWSLLAEETQRLQTLGPELRLSISVADSLNLYVLPPLYRALGQHSPSIRLTIRTQHTDESFESIERKEMDIAFVVREMASPNVVIQPFFKEKMVLMRLAGSQREWMQTVPLQELKPENEIYMKWSTGFQAWHDRWWNPNCVFRIHVDTAALISLLMQEEDQWAIVPLSVGDALIKSGRFVLQQLAESPPERVCYQLTHKFASQSTLQGIRLLERYKERCGIGGKI